MRKLYETNRILALAGLKPKVDPCPTLEEDIRALFKAIDALEMINEDVEVLDENFFSNLLKKKEATADAADKTKDAADKVSTDLNDPKVQEKFSKLASYMSKDIKTYVEKLKKYLAGDMKGGSALHQKAIARAIDQFNAIDLLSTEADVKKNPEPQGEAEKSLPAEVKDAKGDDLEKAKEGKVETKDEIAAKEKAAADKAAADKNAPGNPKVKLLPNAQQEPIDQVTADLPVEDKNKGYAAAFAKFEGKLKRGMEPKDITSFQLSMFDNEKKEIIPTGDKLLKSNVLKTLSMDKFVTMPQSDKGKIVGVIGIDKKPYITSGILVIGLMLDGDNNQSVYIITENGGLYVANVTVWKH